LTALRRRRICQQLSVTVAQVLTEAKVGEGALQIFDTSLYYIVLHFPWCTVTSQRVTSV
jgi:hypothetical protein